MWGTTLRLYKDAIQKMPGYFLDIIHTKKYPDNQENMLLDLKSHFTNIRTSFSFQSV